MKLQSSCHHLLLDVSSALVIVVDVSADSQSKTVIGRMPAYVTLLAETSEHSPLRKRSLNAVTSIRVPSSVFPSMQLLIRIIKIERSSYNTTRLRQNLPRTPHTKKLEGTEHGRGRGGGGGAAQGEAEK